MDGIVKPNSAHAKAQEELSRLLAERDLEIKKHQACTSSWVASPKHVSLQHDTVPILLTTSALYPGPPVLVMVLSDFCSAFVKSRNPCFAFKNHEAAPRQQFLAGRSGAS